MDGGRDPPGKGNPRYEGLTGGEAGRTRYYLARRYFNLSVKEWDDLPWWEAELLMEGLRAQHIIGVPGDQANQTNNVAVPKDKPRLDVTTAPLETIGGFTTRRAG